jgi:hypothetical protein
VGPRDVLRRAGFVAAMIPAARCPSEFRRAKRHRVHRLCPGLGTLSTMIASWA